MTQNISPKIAFFDEKSCKLMLSSFLKLVQYDEKRSKISLIDSVNSVLIFENDEKIVDLTIVNPQIPVDKAAHKKSIFDIRAKYNNGEQIIIEMQRKSAPDFKKRSQHIINIMRNSLNERLCYNGHFIFMVLTNLFKQNESACALEKQMVQYEKSHEQGKTIDSP